MSLVFDIASSIEFWRQRYPTDRTPNATFSASPCSSSGGKRAILESLPEWVDEKFLDSTDGVFHALAIGSSYSKRFESLCTHRWNSAIPEGSFYELQPGVFVESPEFMFLHAATILDFAQLIAFGDELCGLYSFDANTERGFVKRRMPLTTKARLSLFLMQKAGLYGRNPALRALPHIVEHSASPMETFDQMTMCLPVRYGGYALPQPTMNEQIDLTEKAARIAGRKKCYLDMGYSGHHLDIEHHGKLDHSSDADKESDFARVSGLREMGIEVIELTSVQVNDLFAYEYIVQRAARILGKRIRKEWLGPTPKRLALRHQLFEWNRSCGRIR